MLVHVMLEQAWKAIDAPEKWCRRLRHNIMTGERCALGALDTKYRNQATYLEACAALVAVIPSEWEKNSKYGRSPHSDYIVAEYNNSRASWEEIRIWWQAAIEHARRKHNQPIVDKLIQIIVPETKTGNLERLPA